MCCVQSELRPPLCHLRSLLLQSGLYSGVLSADDSDASGGDGSTSGAVRYTFSSLRRLVAASDDQLRVQLHSLTAYVVDDSYRLLRADYAHSLVQDVINAIIETKQPAHKVSKETVIATIGHLHPPAITQQCLHALAPHSTQPSHSDECISLCPERVSQQLAHSIFQSAPPASHWQPAEQLLQALTSAMPAPLTCQPAHLLSIAVLLPSTPATPSTYRYLPAASLPVDVKSRLSAMFAVKDKWSSEEMAAWMADISSGSLADGRGSSSSKADTALLKHCRTVTEREVNGNKKQTLYYVSSAHR